MPAGARWNSSFSYCGPYILCGLSRLGLPGVDLTGAQVSTRTQPNGDVIEEFRVAGQLRVVKVTPSG